MTTTPSIDEGLDPSARTAAARRVGLAVSMLVAPWFIVAAETARALTTAGNQDDTDPVVGLHLTAAHLALTRWASLAAMLGALLLVPAVLGVMRLVRTRAARLGLVGGVLTATGYICYFALVFHGAFTQAAMVTAGGSLDQDVDVLRRFDADPLGALWVGPLFVGREHRRDVPARLGAGARPDRGAARRLRADGVAGAPRAELQPLRRGRRRRRPGAGSGDGGRGAVADGASGRRRPGALRAAAQVGAAPRGRGGGRRRTRTARSLRKMWRTWVSTVRSVVCNRRAAAAFDRPSASSMSTSARDRSVARTLARAAPRARREATTSGSSADPPAATRRRASRKSSRSRIRSLSR